jgi:hypothetical protein
VRLAKRCLLNWPGRHRAASVALLAAFSAIGCGSSEPSPPPPNDGNNMRGIISYYSTATSQLGRPPQNMNELKAVLAGVVADPSQFFRSTRDGEEYVVVWGLRLQTSPPDTIVAYERTGVNGKRMVMQLNGIPKEVTQEEFAKLKFPKDHKVGGA